MAHMKTKWTEVDLKAFPAGEHDYFDRKSGALLQQSDFRLKIAKALSAFANSAGGQLLLGVKNDGTFDGVSPLRGRQPTREWLEQVVPTLLSPQLTEFRVHEIQAVGQSEIPQGTVVIVIEAGDSPHAPHQVEEDKVYYFRSAGHSVPAPHFYLESLRNRLVRPVFAASLESVKPIAAFRCPDGIFVQLLAGFRVTNEGRVLARYWFLDVVCQNEILLARNDFRRSTPWFPSGGPKYDDEGMRIGAPLLPGLPARTKRIFGVNLRPTGDGDEAIADAVKTLFSTNPALQFSLCSENVRSDAWPIDEGLLRDALAPEKVSWLLPNASDPRKLYAGYGLYVYDLKVAGIKDIRGHVSFSGTIHNSSEKTYSTVRLTIHFENEDGHTVASKEVRIEQLPRGDKPFFSWVEAADVLNYRSTRAVAAVARLEEI
jgi:hypothetical protein